MTDAVRALRFRWYHGLLAGLPLMLLLVLVPAAAVAAPPTGPEPGAPAVTPTPASQPAPGASCAPTDPTCVSGAPATPPAGNPGGVPIGIALPSPGDLVRQLLDALDWRKVIGGVITGAYDTLFNDLLERLGRQLAAILTWTPDPRAFDGAMGNLGGLVETFRLAAVALCTAVFAFTAAQFLLGQVREPQAALGRLVAVLFVLGFYRTLIGYLITGTNALAQAVVASGSDQTGNIVAALRPAAPVLALPTYLVMGAIAGTILVVVLVCLKYVGFLFLLVTYIAGPLLLPLAIYPPTAGFVAKWGEHLAKAMIWPVVWAIELRLFGALVGNVVPIDPRALAADSALQSILNMITALSLLGLMAATPWGIHTQFTVKQGVDVVVRAGQRVGRLAAGVAAAA
ncbi:MAG TPA: hypothetical protein VFL91_29705 [Thermomicrobiales bacterium]|nr:hypothetical protein [Thermomicrobiales bacterium]